MLAMLVYMYVHGPSNKYKHKQPRSSTTFCLQMSCGSANIYFYDLWIQIRRFQGEPFYGRDSLLDIKNLYCLFQCIISHIFHFVSFNLSLSQDQTPKSKCKFVSCKDTSSMIYNLCFKNYMGPWDNFMGDTIYTRVSSSSYICNVLELELIYVCLVPH